MPDAEPRSRDDIPIEPLYPRHRDVFGAPFPDARPWTIVQSVDDPDPDRANDQALDDIAGGAAALAVRFAGADPAGRSGLPASQDALRIALAGIDFARIEIRLEPHTALPDAALWLSHLVARSGTAPERAALAFYFDPVAASTAQEVAIIRARFSDLVGSGFRPRVFLDARAVHGASASEAQELAAILAAAASWLSALDRPANAPGEPFDLLAASMSADRDLYLSIAKLRALRLLWSRFQEVCGAPVTPLSIHAETSRRMLTRVDPEGNLLRTTLAAFAAAVGGADAITIVPHTAAVGLPDRTARAAARNIHHLLIAEAHLGCVADPAAGSGAIETLTEELAARAWTEFQTIESEGGMAESLRAGKFQARVGLSRDALRREVVDGARPLVGATVYRLGEKAPVSAGPVADRSGGLSPINLEALVQPA